MPDWFKHNPKLPLAITLQKGEKPSTKYPYWGSILQMIGFWHVALCQDHRSSTLGSIKSMVRRQLWKEQRCLGYRICFEIVVKLLGIYVNYWSSFRNLLHIYMYIHNIHVQYQYTLHISICMLLSFWKDIYLHWVIFDHPRIEELPRICNRCRTRFRFQMCIKIVSKDTNVMGKQYVF